MINVFDYAILAVVTVSALLGVFRGFIRESLALISWLLAFWIAYTYASAAGVYFQPYLSSAPLQVAAAFVALFVISLLLLTVVSSLIYRLLAISGVGGTDRVMGGFFGVVRAVVIIAGFMLVAGITSLPQEPWWRDSMLAKHFNPLVLLIRDLLPADIAKQLMTK